MSGHKPYLLSLTQYLQHLEHSYTLVLVSVSFCCATNHPKLRDAQGSVALYLVGGFGSARQFSVWARLSLLGSSSLRGQWWAAAGWISRQVFHGVGDQQAVDHGRDKRASCSLLPCRAPHEAVAVMSQHLLARNCIFNPLIFHLSSLQE